LDEFKNDVQKLIEESLMDQDWASAFGHVERPDKGGHESYLYLTRKPVAGVYPMEDFLLMRGAIHQVLRHANTRSCRYNLERGGTIEFEFED
jgi:hypothetical protein